VGPKLPAVNLISRGGGIDTLSQRYAPVGGLARFFGSAEVQLPVPGFSDAWQSFVFLDAGRIWIPDSRFALNSGELDQGNYFTSVGAGVGYETVVGAIEVALGYKLNPSALDLRSPEQAFEALRQGRSVSSFPEEPLRRLHLHLAIGATF
jgi:outer membrane protein assembly factor BamA